ncbi:DUF2071 domain-containing protein [Nibribacter ruber]|uniref:DUF2071 domain-containing protein n=1 Tax=Nibribacter ruber TaxID=2698458 RepID=A0A6P1NXD4_9BACT|nr:DUF2071 domain-containing protein [Nibribacter ruber]QHL86578.1 DUF2071 domain-containing protein [Nibribacter ruber]
MQNTFLQAEWRKLILANYEIDPAILVKYLPAGTELDFWKGTCFVSLVGFMFQDTKLKGLPIPFHTDFEEVNLRFYVKRLENGIYKRGVVFIKEIVPKPALSLVANVIYGEPYVTARMKHSWVHKEVALEVEYQWKKNVWHSLKVAAASNCIPITEYSEAEFITEHYWGYTKRTQKKTSVYEVTHPRWDMYPVSDYSIQVDFQLNYGADFGFLSTATPTSVFLAEGSPIIVKVGSVLNL